MYTWHGDASGGQAHGQAGQAGQANQDPTQGNHDPSRTNHDPTQAPSPLNAVGSTTWLPVETCQPCQQQPVAAPTATSAGGSSGGVSLSGTLQVPSIGGSTEQVGVTQNSGVAGALATGPPPSASASGGSGGGTSGTRPTSAATGNGLGNDDSNNDDSDGDQLSRRDGETVTKNGQCCRTTWTPSVVGGSGGGGGATGSAGQSGTNKAVQTTGAAATAASGTKGISTGAAGSASTAAVSKPTTGIGAPSQSVNHSVVANSTAGAGGLTPGNVSTTNGTGGAGNKSGNATGDGVKAAMNPVGSLHGLLWSTVAALAVGSVSIGFTV